MNMKIKDSQSAPLKVEGLEVVMWISEGGGVRKFYLPREEVQQDEVPVAPAYYVGRQKGTNGMDDIDFFNLTQTIPGHVQGSTVSGRILKAAGFRLPVCVPNHVHERVLDKIRQLVRLMA